MRDKAGNYLTFKEYMIRWKQGIENLTPLQKITNDIRGTFITLLGFIFSLFAVIWLREKIGLLAYGLTLIFVGTSITTFFKWIGLRQQLKYFNEIETQTSFAQYLNQTEVKDNVR